MLTPQSRSELTTIIKAYVNKFCVFRCDPNKQYVPDLPRGTISGKGGSPLKWQVYLRRLTHDSDMMAGVAMLMLDKMFRNGEVAENIQFAGMETSSLPIISFLQGWARNQNFHVNSYSVRKERKSYGLFNVIDGKPNTNNFVVIDDITNSGTTINAVCDVSLYELDLSPALNSYFILNLNPEKTYHVFNGYFINVNSILTLNDIMTDYQEDLYWEPEDCQRIENYRPDYS